MDSHCSKLRMIEIKEDIVHIYLSCEGGIKLRFNDSNAIWLASAIDLGSDKLEKDCVQASDGYRFNLAPC